MRKKWTVPKKKNCYRNIQLPGGFASFPGAREVSSISGSLPDDPGGNTCMHHYLQQKYLLRHKVENPVPEHTFLYKTSYLNTIFVRELLAGNSTKQTLQTL